MELSHSKRIKRENLSLNWAGKKLEPVREIIKKCWLLEFCSISFANKDIVIGCLKHGFAALQM